MKSAVHIPYRPARTLADAEVIRTIRNAGRSWFADDAYITPEQQITWWAKMSALPREDFRCFLSGDPPTGYGMLIRREERWWVSLAVSAKAQGQGIGTAIYAKLAREAWPKGCYAAILVDNIASRCSADKAGYVLDATKICPPGISSGDLQRWIVLRHRG